MTGIYIAFTAWVIADICFLVTGVNRLRWMRLMAIHSWMDYFHASVWLWIGAAGFVSFGLAVYTLSTKGLPPTYNGIGAWGWIRLGVGFAISFMLAFTSYVSLRNARQHTAEQREAAAKLHRVMSRLRATTEGNYDA